jgi:hypothetical protein
MKTKTVTIFRWMQAIVGLLSVSSQTSAQTSSEYQLKAVFLYNFAHFVDWPETSYSIGEPFTIGVLGEHHFGSALEEAIRGEMVHGRSIQIQYYKSPEEIKSCHILFVSKSQKKNLKAILSKVGKHTLTVSDDDSFNEAGGMIRFYRQQNKIRLSINKTALDSTQLIVSSKLLRLGEAKD